MYERGKMKAMVSLVFKKIAWKKGDAVRQTSPGRNTVLLSDDLVVEVLCRLPAKSLMRCCCVCRGWYVLIMSCCVPRITPSLPLLGCQIRIVTREDSVFEGALLPQAEAAGVADAWPPMFSADDGSLDYVRHSPLYLRDSSNGLMLFVQFAKPNYVLWNPTTKEFLSIPFASNNRRVFSVLAVGIKNVKVVAFPRDKGVVYVFSSQTCTWAERTVKYIRPVDRETSTPLKRSVYLHGRLFRLGQPRRLLWYTISDDNVDVVCDSVKLPGSDHTGVGKGRRGKKKWCIGSSGGRLQFAQKDHGLGLVQIWVFSFDTSEWNLVHSVSLQALAKHPQLVDATALFPVVNPKFKLLTFDPVSDDGMIIWTPNLIFCYYWKCGNLIPLQGPNIPNDALEHPPVDAFPFTQWVAPLGLSRPDKKEALPRNIFKTLLRVAWKYRCIILVAQSVCILVSLCS
ncbi:hypothetical protein V6N13_031013 [Hibiscus sabdariffa]